MKRREDWPERLNSYLDSVRKTPGEWGKLDCCTLVFDAVLAMTDEDCGAAFRGRYHDADGAYAIVHECGGSLASLFDGLAEEFGWGYPESLKHVQRGDVCLLSSSVVAGEARFGGAGGICIGGFVACVGQRLLATSPKHIIRAWRIP